MEHSRKFAMRLCILLGLATLVSGIHWTERPIRSPARQKPRDLDRADSGRHQIPLRRTTARPRRRQPWRRPRHRAHPAITKAGLKPAGTKALSFQAVPMVMVTTEPKATLSATKGNETINFKLEGEFAGTCETQQSEDSMPRRSSSATASPRRSSLGRLQGRRREGKVVVLFTNEPPSDDPKFFAGTALTY